MNEPTENKMGYAILITVFLAGLVIAGVVASRISLHRTDGTRPHLITGSYKSGEEPIRTFSYGCGYERWPVKTTTDATAYKVDASHVIWTSIGRLDALTAPSPLPQDSRVAPFEATVFRITNVTLVQLKQEADSDYHLVIRGTSGNHMIAEIPSSSCISSPTHFAAAIASARQAVDSRYAVGGSWIYPNRQIDLTGIGFADFCHGATGAGPSCLEIHPILSIVFK